MTDRRLPHTPATADRTGGDDRPEPNCAGNPHPYDELIEHGVTRSTRLALRIARDLCGVNDDGTFRDVGCPFRNTCLSANQGERWAQAVLGLPVHDVAGRSRGSEAARGVHAKRRAERLEELSRLLEQGADADEACRALDTTREGLYKWCHRWGHLDIWRALSPAKPEAVVRRNDPRRRKAVAA